MKNRIGVILAILVLVCAGLGIALVAVKRQAGQEKRVLTVTSQSLSNNLVQATDQLERQRQANALLESDREERRKAFESLSNNYTLVVTSLAQTSNSLVQTETALKVSQEETAKKDARITELETQNQSLDKQATELSTAITNLTTEIEETKRKLATSEGEKGFLEKELKRLMAEKSELERQFNDLTVLKAQVSKLKSEMAVARRLDWIRRGLFATTDQKGAQKLVGSMVEAKVPKATYDLNVEVNADGSVSVIPPLTNRPAATPPKKK